MPETKTSITDNELLAQLQKSYIQEGQKKDLEPLIPHMTGEERAQLMGLIEQSNSKADEAKGKYQKNINKINKDYNDKLHEISRENKEGTVKRLEAIDRKGAESELKEVEAEMTMAAKPETEMTAKSARQELGKAKKHTLRKIMLFLIFLGLVAGGILYLLNIL